MTNFLISLFLIIVVNGLIAFILMLEQLPILPWVYLTLGCSIAGSLSFNLVVFIGVKHNQDKTSLDTRIKP